MGIRLSVIGGNANQQAVLLPRCCHHSFPHNGNSFTLSAYKDDINRFIIPKLVNRRLISIRGNDISGFYLELLRTPKHNSSGTLSVSTVRHIDSVLGSIFKRAVMWEYISVNPCDAQHSEMPKTQTAVRKRQILDAEGILTLLEYLDGDVEVRVPVRHRTNPRTEETYEVAGYTTRKKTVSDKLILFFYMALFLGCRRGELIALRWSDIDLDLHVVHITRDTVLCTNHKVVHNRTKNSSSIRDVPIPDRVLELLLLHRKAQKDEKRDADVSYYTVQGIPQNAAALQSGGSPLIR